MKAGKRPKAPSAGGGKDMQKQMQQVQAMQRKMDELQGEIDKMEATATSGGGAVTVTANGKKEITNIQIKPEVVDPEDIEMLQDMIVAAVNEAMGAADKANAEVMSKMTGGLGGFGF